MLFFLALIAQTTPLAADPFTAANLCARATTAAQAGLKSQMSLTSQFTFYAMHAARARLEGKSFTARLQEISNDARTVAPMTREAGQALVSQCEARFPRPAATPVSALPADAFARDVLCLGVLSILQGAAQSLAAQGDTSLARINVVLTPLQGRLDDPALKRRGIDTEAKFMAVFDDQLRLSVELGEPRTIAAACGVGGI